jgi:hypothetical protein
MNWRGPSQVSKWNPTLVRLRAHPRGAVGRRLSMERIEHDSTQAGWWWSKEWMGSTAAGCCGSTPRWEPTPRVVAARWRGLAWSHRSLTSVVLRCHCTSTLVLDSTWPTLYIYMNYIPCCTSTVFLVKCLFQARFPCCPAPGGSVHGRSDRGGRLSRLGILPAGTTSLCGSSGRAWFLLPPTQTRYY